MNSKTLRRLAADHASLHTAELPANWLWPSSKSSNASCCDDLTSLTVLLAGPEGTPFSSALFTLSLSIPPTYPNTAPTASFKTKIFHPNVDPNTGSVCVDTLKRDWKPELRLRDILVVISCLLISPNPASALNAEAGRLCENDYALFEKRAKTWASIHARCPRDLIAAVEEARRRGEGKQPTDIRDADKSLDVGNMVTERRPRGKRKIMNEASLEHPETSENGSKAKGTETGRTSLQTPLLKTPTPLAASADNMLGINIGPDFPADATRASSDATSATTSIAVSPPPASADLSSHMQLPQPLPSPELPRAIATPTLIRPTAFTTPMSPLTDLTSMLQNKIITSPVPGPHSSLRHLQTHPRRQSSPSWLSWQVSPSHEDGGSETAPERAKRMKLEERRLKAAGGCLKRYNSGVFGVRKGLKRL